MGEWVILKLQITEWGAWRSDGEMGRLGDLAA